MSKSRIMGAASCGTNYGVNKNSPGNGNGKWQGLWPSVGHAKNARLINTRAGGDNRNVVFCMNQLGGVGRISKMFATTADGVKDCGCILPSHVKEALYKLGDYALSQNKQLCLVGETETLSSDVPGHSGSFDKTFPTNLDKYVKIINNLKLEFAVKGPNDVQRHIVAMVTQPDAIVLKEYGFGFPVLCNNIIAYASDKSSFMINNFGNKRNYEIANYSAPNPNTMITLYFRILPEHTKVFSNEGIEIFLDQPSLTQDVFVTSSTISEIKLNFLESYKGADDPKNNVIYTLNVSGARSEKLKLTNINDPAAGIWSVTISGNAMVLRSDFTSTSQYYLMGLVNFTDMGPVPNLTFKLGTNGASFLFPKQAPNYRDGPFY